MVGVPEPAFSALFLRDESSAALSPKVFSRNRRAHLLLIQEQGSTPERLRFLYARSGESPPTGCLAWKTLGSRLYLGISEGHFFLPHHSGNLLP